MPNTLYGIPNCDQVKKARAWLAARKVPHTFHDFKKSGINLLLIDGWLKHVSWETLINRKGTTWRGLSEGMKASITDLDAAKALMLEQPSVIKRPVLCTDTATHVGFSDDLYQQIFQK
ncbi:MAG: ArsC family reductase [Burkholderiales bacterium]|nr:ArsC family reductase [Burkholderiales bacterium]